MLRLCGPLLMATGAIHLFFGLTAYWHPLGAIARDGFFDAVESGGATSVMERELAVWFMLFGVMAIILGGLVRWAQLATGTLPAFLGWSVLLISVGSIVLMPASGFWIVVPQGVMMILASRKSRRRATSDDYGVGEIR